MEEKNTQSCCAKCKYEQTCGYSPLSTLGKRTDESFIECGLGDKSDGVPFFEVSEVAPL